MLKTVPLLLATVLALAIPTASFAAESLPAGASYDVGFSPYGDSLKIVLKGIESAKQEILVAAYSFTSKPVATALIDAAHRGVKVMVVADKKDNSKGYSAAQFLANEHIPVRLNGNYPIMHSKLVLIDGRHVQTGSYNYSAAAASKNQENVLLLWNVPALAAKYRAEWVRLWNESTPLEAAY